VSIWVDGAIRRTKSHVTWAFAGASLLVVAPAAAEDAPKPAATTEPVPTKEVLVRGDTRAARLRRSALAVEVVELEDHKRRSQDLGEVLVRSSSLTVQREGGLGSSGRYSLNGLSGDRVRFFIDGVPLEYSGYLFGVGNVPVNLLDRVEVYQGVVPIRFGADALGGAVNLVTDDQVRKSKLGAAYEFGSFNTHRLSFGARHFFAPQKAFVRANGFFDHADNDYPVDVQVFDDEGSLSPAKVRRFHDGYRGLGATLAVGLVDRGWADRLVLQGFVSSYQREIQNSIGMTVPYGEVQAPRSAAGGNLKYAKQFSEAARLDVALGYSFRHAGLRDVSHCRYDWYGRCFLTLPLAGEIASIPIDRSIDEHTGFARAQASFVPTRDHTLRLALTPTLVQRTGRDKEIDPSEYDPLRAKRSLVSNVLGLEYEINAGVVSSIVFGKAYQQWARSEERLPTGATNRLSTDQFLFGAGDSLRVSLWKHGYAKASYEYAARLPSANERFGDGGLVAENLRLEPERSHNYNLGFVLDGQPTPFGRLRAQISGVGRRVDRLIVLLNAGSYYQYGNVLSARVLGIDSGAGWSALGDWCGLDGRFSYQDVRNDSDSGPGALFKNDRIPNQPYLQASVSPYVRAHALRTPRDYVELAGSVRYVHSFLRGWESAGSDAIKLKIPSQTVYSLALSYVSVEGASTLSTSFEAQNLTNAQVFDFYGEQRPGRSFHWKMTIDTQ
jgi:vitamin B12 transporter